MMNGEATGKGLDSRANQQNANRPNGKNVGTEDC
jgi:hypothetical protein